MTEDEYNQMTVVDIRAEFKRRGIPTTGLSKKAQLIQRLLKDDAEATQPAEEAKVDEQPEEEAPVAPLVPVADDAVDHAVTPVVPEPATEPAATPPTAELAVIEDRPEPVLAVPVTVTEPVAAEPPTVTAPPSEPLTAPLVPESRPEDILEPAPAPVVPTIDSLAGSPPIVTTTNMMEKRDSIDMSRMPNAPPPPFDATSDSVPAAAIDEEPGSSALDSDLADESRKRKRRSVTPPLSAEEIAQKKLKQDHDNAGIVQLKEDNEVVVHAPIPRHPDEPMNPPAAMEVPIEQPTKVQIEGALADPPLVASSEPTLKDQRI